MAGLGLDGHGLGLGGREHEVGAGRGYDCDVS